MNGAVAAVLCVILYDLDLTVHPRLSPGRETQMVQVEPERWWVWGLCALHGPHM